MKTWTILACTLGFLTGIHASEAVMPFEFSLPEGFKGPRLRDEKTLKEWSYFRETADGGINHFFRIIEASFSGNIQDEKMSTIVAGFIMVQNRERLSKKFTEFRAEEAKWVGISGKKWVRQRWEGKDKEIPVSGFTYAIGKGASFYYLEFENSSGQSDAKIREQVLTSFKLK